jgi:hypothetical protein
MRNDELIKMKKSSIIFNHNIFDEWQNKIETLFNRIFKYTKKNQLLKFSIFVKKLKIY